MIRDGEGHMCNVHVVVCAKNEADIVEAFLRHALQWASKVHMVLHRCHDNTEDIVRAVRDEGASVDIDVSTNLSHIHGVAISRLAHKAASEGADWVCPLDTDEFVVGPLTQTCQRAAEFLPVTVPWRCYVPLPTDLASETNILKRIQHRRDSERPQWSKVIVPGAMLRSDPSLRLGYGSHQLFNASGQALMTTNSDLAIAHFPVRSDRQFRCKVFGGWLANVADASRKRGNTFQWKSAFDEAKHGHPFTDARLHEIALDYATYRQWNDLSESFRSTNPHEPAAADRRRSSVVHDPVPCNFEVTLPVHSAEPMRVLLDSAESFAEAYGALCARYGDPQERPIPRKQSARHL